MAPAHSNKDFEEKFDHGQTAPDDKIDKKFWEAGQGRKPWWIMVLCFQFTAGFKDTEYHVW